VRGPTNDHQPPTINQLSTNNQLRNIRISRIRTLGSWDRIRTVPVSSVAERSCVGKVERSGQTVGTEFTAIKHFTPRKDKRIGFECFTIGGNRRKNIKI